MLPFSALSPKVAGLLKKVILRELPRIVKDNTTLDSHDDSKIYKTITERLPAELEKFMTSAAVLCGLLESRAYGVRIDATLFLTPDVCELLASHFVKRLPCVFELVAVHGTYETLLENLIDKL